MRIKFTLTLIALIFFTTVHAQLGSCSGSKGDPIFHEDFGSGSGSGAALPTGTTNYQYVSQGPNDGQYTINSNFNSANSSWHNNPNTSLSGGKALIVNASYTAGEFYVTTVSGLCENTTYEFSAYVMNIYNRSSNVCGDNGGGGIPINVKFQIWDETNTKLLAEGDTGDITSTSSPTWNQEFLTFRSEPGQGTVILKMANNGVGGCGNDLAIDDIIFRTCGDLTTIKNTDTNTNQLDLCPVEIPKTVTLMASPDNSVYTDHYYQWQESADGETWTDISGQTDQNFTTVVTSSNYYRVKIAEDPANLVSNLCSSASSSFYINVIAPAQQPVSNGDKSICGSEAIPTLSVTVQNDETAYWYDAATGGNLIAQETASYTPQTSGTFYVEAVKKGYACSPSSRVAITLTINDSPEFDTDEEIIEKCPDNYITLDAGLSKLNYKWSTGETTKQIQIKDAGTYTVIASTNEGCSAMKTFTVTTVTPAEIADISSEEYTVTITPVNEGNFEYSLDGVNFQDSNVFKLVPGGVYTAYMRDKVGCSLVTQRFVHLVLPRFITPNNDGVNDVFELKGIEAFGSSSIAIFDRYGRLLVQGNGVNFKWDGTRNNVRISAGEYWYVIQIENYPPIKGHFALKR
ncbi:T9SS type B sorting domain-containing protein [Zhouia sp. PK063]|uniref:T9SS type B sorting domain-containing protein n=1 Tax=Zhouia sp. PK063 TaxID=3373602 RepID=UPI00379E47D3